MGTRGAGRWSLPSPTSEIEMKFAGPAADADFPPPLVPAPEAATAGDEDCVRMRVVAAGGCAAVPEVPRARWGAELLSAAEGATMRTRFFVAGDIGSPASAVESMAGGRC